MKHMMSIALLLATTGSHAQTLSASNLVLTGPSNSQMIGGAGASGDTSCPVLANLSAGQFATCYFSGTGTWELGYAGGTYSPIARMSELQTAQATLQASFGTLQGSVSGMGIATTSLQSTVTSLQNSVSGMQSTTTSLQATVTSLQSSVSGMQNSFSSLQNQVNTGPVSQSTGSTTMLDVISNGPLNLGLGFNTVGIANIVQDTASAFNRQTGIFTIPTSGTYLCVAKLRLADNVPAHISYGLGVGTTNADQPGFVWFVTAQVDGGPSRNGAGTTSVAYYTAGQQVRMYSYVDTANPLPISSAELTIVRLGS